MNILANDGVSPSGAAALTAAGHTLHTDFVDADRLEAFIHEHAIDGVSAGGDSIGDSPFDERELCGETEPERSSTRMRLICSELCESRRTMAERSVCSIGCSLGAPALLLSRRSR